MSNVISSTLPRRSVLFASAVHSAAIEQALGSKADLVCLDMEDGVPLDKKALGRDAVVRLLAEAGADARARVAVRINCPRSVEGLRDILALSALEHDLQLVVPKLCCAADVLLVRDVFRERGRTAALHCVIETGEALENVEAIARSCGNVVSLFFGGFDLSAALGVDMAWEPLQYARSRVVHAAATAGLDVLDAPHLSLDGPDALRETTERCRSFGFTGRITKHPEQAEIINSVFTPSVASLEEAAAIVAQFEASPYSQVVIDGKVIEQPAIRAMKRQLAAVGAGGTN